MGRISFNKGSLGRGRHHFANRTAGGGVERHQSTLTRALLITASLIACVLLFEGSLRLWEAVTTAPHPQNPATSRTNEWSFFQYDRVLGWRNRPGAEGWFEIPDSTTYVRISSEGLRDIIHGPRSDRYRILVLGDSFVWGFGVDDDQRLTNRLQDILGQSVEVINAGVSGWGTDQELLYLQDTGRFFEPNLVVLVLGLEDLDNIHSSVEYSYPKPFYVLRDGTLELQNVPVPERNVSWTSHFGVQPYHLRSPTSSSTEPPGPTYRAHLFLRRYLHSYRFAASRSSQILARRGWTRKPVDPLLRELLSAVHAACSQAGARLLLVVIPYRFHIANPHDDPIKDAVLAAADKAAIECLDLWPLFRRQVASGSSLYFEIDPHWNPAGHDLAANELATHLREKEWLQDNSRPSGSATAPQDSGQAGFSNSMRAQN